MARARYGPASDDSIATSHGCLTGYRIVVDGGSTSGRCGPTPLATARASWTPRATAFAEAGLDVGVEEIARRAGVGKGTLYRRFPTKEALVRAIFEDILDEIERLVGRGRGASRRRGRRSRATSARAARMQASNQGFFDVVAQRLGAAALDRRAAPRASLAATAAPAASAPRRRARCARDLVPEDVQLMLRMVGATTRPAPDGTPDGRALAALPRAAARRAAPGGGDPLPAEPWRPSALERRSAAASATAGPPSRRPRRRGGRAGR